jgi:hypothetical protein
MVCLGVLLKRKKGSLLLHCTNLLGLPLPMRVQWGNASQAINGIDIKEAISCVIAASLLDALVACD